MKSAFAQGVLWRWMRGRGDATYPARARWSNYLRPLLLVVAVVCPQSVHAQAADTVRGRITTDSGAAITGAQVIVTRAPDRLSLFDTTDSRGGYRIVFNPGTGDYLVHASAVGYETDRKRLTRVAGEQTLTLDFRLRSSVHRIATVTVVAERPKPSRGPGYTTEIGEAGSYSEGINAAVPPGLSGDLTATATTMPGVSSVRGGISVLGLGAAQNNTTLNGLAFSGGAIPRDADLRVKTTTSTYDPSRGWFAGAQTSAEIAPGSYFSHYSASATADAPMLQYTDALSSAAGQRFTNILGSAGGHGEFPGDVFAYNFGLEANRLSSDAPTLVRADPRLLQRAGLSPDSASRFFSLASGLSLPLDGIAASHRSETNISAIARIDHTPYDFNTINESKRTWGVLTYLSRRRSSALGFSPLATSGHGGEETASSFTIQGVFSSFDHVNYLFDARSAFSLDDDHSDPYLRVPEGRVRITSELGGGPGGFSSLLFGGNPDLNVRARRWTSETTGTLQFYPAKRTSHRLRFDVDSRIDGFRDETTRNELGSYTFNSLADFGNNRAASFTRTLASPVRSGNEWNGFVSAGDNWKISRSVRLLYGLRLEGNRFLSGPGYNPDIEQLFGMRTDHAPNTIHLSPRVGFTWIRTDGGGGMSFSPLGQFNFGAPSYVRGGIGEFRTMLPANLISDPLRSTGLNDGSRSISCVGAAVPVPDWTAFNTDASQIPSACTGDPIFPQLADAAATVQLLDRNYTAPRSWRANLGYTSNRWKMDYTIDGTVSLNLNQPGRRDLNFSGIPKGWLSDEGRVMFVPASSVVPETGAVSAVGARKTPDFGSVLDDHSDLRSVSRQVAITLTPNLPYKYYLSLAYVLSSNRAWRSGFDAPAFGNPLPKEWSRGDFDSRHQFTVQGGVVVKGVGVTLFSRLQSGFPFTPLVGGDVNGDGYVNDRAFVFGSSGPDPAVASATATLLNSSSRRVRKCLLRQMGRPAAVNSCEGPWTALMNLQLNKTSSFGNLSRSANFVLSFANPLGGLDQLLHGSRGLRGWGTFALPDPVLYNIRGFDPAGNRFRYEVNPQFGSTRSANALHAPFRVTLSVSVPLGAPVPQQMLDRWLKPGRGGIRGKKMDAAELIQRYERNQNDPFAEVLDEADSLLLSKEQVLALQAADTVYNNALDSLFSPLAQRFESLPDRFNEREALRLQEATIDAANQLAWRSIRRVLPQVLNPIQLRILPGYAAALLAADKWDPGGRTYRINE